MMAPGRPPGPHGASYTNPALAPWTARTATPVHTIRHKSCLSASFPIARSIVDTAQAGASVLSVVVGLESDSGTVLRKARSHPT
jgi:hypothetical protein